MAEQYNDAVEKLEDPELRKKYERERRNFMQELAEAAKDHPTLTEKQKKERLIR